MSSAMGVALELESYGQIPSVGVPLDGLQAVV